MRIATYNVEWFTELFDNAGRLLNDEGPSGREKIARADQIAALGIVFQRLDADVILIIEAPDENHRRHTVPALENFAQQAGLRATKAIIGFGNDTQQEIAALYDPEQISLRHDPRGSTSGSRASRKAPRFDGEFHIDLDIDASEDRVVFSKPPLELTATTKGGHSFHMIGAHLKSKAPHGARSDAQAMRISIANRRKQLAQAIWLRRRIDTHLAKGTPLVVLGDLNDGPGLDQYENLFGRSSVEIIMGIGQLGEEARDHAPLYDPHAMQGLSTRLGAIPTTARFFLQSQDCYLQALLDYIMVSQDLMAKRPAWRIWHPFNTPECLNDEQLRSALLVASDHFPVTMDIEI
jgi:endonuclease/exonuclease/phosphatase family metal-dependent hydrolase